MNGKLKIALSFAGILAATSLVFTMGASWSVMNQHVNGSVSSEIHQTTGDKQRLIDERFDLKIAPMRVQLNEMNKKLDRLLAAELEHGK